MFLLGEQIVSQPLYFQLITDLHQVIIYSIQFKPNLLEYPFPNVKLLFI